MLEEFKNEALTDFSQDANRRRMSEALERVRSELGREYPLVIGGERIRTKDAIRRKNPSNIDETVGIVAKAEADHVERAVAAATAAFESWRKVPGEERARYLWKGAAIMRRRKLELAAWMVEEVGKSWAEADADVAEAIDFLDFYGREMARLAGPQPLTRLPGEDNELYYIPLGPGVVIPPWNFPLAILAGMTSAAIVAGNPVILKPASVSPVIGAKFVEVMEEAGLPPGVLTFLPGSGGVVGDALVAHPKTRFVAFTGSKEIGCRISELAGKVVPGQRWIKRVVLEMGGKDAIVVDADAVASDADLALVAQGVVASAFGFQGQKCSACSRLIVHEAVHDRLLEAVVRGANEIKVGPTRDPANTMGPVVEEAAMKSILSYVAIGKSEGRLVAGGDRAPGNGWFVKPTVIADVAPGARIAQEEIFGPVLAVTRARDFDHALEIANGTEFGLTGAVYSKSRAHLERARREFHAGNLYLNRKCTGALVGAHPFGGFNMSGTNSKAGGRDYLLLFTQAKCVSERY